MVYFPQKVSLKSHVDVDVIHQQMKTCLNYPIQLHCVRRVILMMCELYIKKLIGDGFRREFLFTQQAIVCIGIVFESD